MSHDHGTNSLIWYIMNVDFGVEIFKNEMKILCDTCYNTLDGGYVLRFTSV